MGSAAQFSEQFLTAQVVYMGSAWIVKFSSTGLFANKAMEKIEIKCSVQQGGLAQSPSTIEDEGFVTVTAKYIQF